MSSYFEQAQAGKAKLFVQLQRMQPVCLAVSVHHAGFNFFSGLADRKHNNEIWLRCISRLPAMPSTLCSINAQRRLAHAYQEMPAELP